jgi:hypothetical protein
MAIGFLTRRYANNDSASKPIRELLRWSELERTDPNDGAKGGQDGGSRPVVGLNSYILH